MSMKLLLSVMDQSINNKHGWADTWHTFTNGRWFAISTDRWPNSFDDRTGHFKLHPQTVKKLLRDGLAEQIEYAEKDSTIARGGYNEWATPRPHIKLRFTTKGQALVEKELTNEELQQRVRELESQLGITFEIMTDRQIAEYQHLFNNTLHIEDSASTNHTQKGEN
tara:strand:+ start:1097 stop:1594 length:498 start_codon:yes stop_codon:yes gene_type:complete